MIQFTHPSQARDWARLSDNLGPAVVEAAFQRNLERARGRVGRAIVDALADLNLLVNKNRKKRDNALDVNRRERRAERLRCASVDPDGIANRQETVKLMKPAVAPDKKSSRKSGRKRADTAKKSTYFDRSMLEV